MDLTALILIDELLRKDSGYDHCDLISEIGCLLTSKTQSDFRNAITWRLEAFNVKIAEIITKTATADYPNSDYNDRIRQICIRLLQLANN